MRLPESYLSRHSSGSVAVAGVSVLELASRYGTPLFVFIEEQIQKNYRELLASLSAYKNSRIFYACKANGLLAILDVLRREGAGIDVVSGGELFLAQKAGFKSEDIILNGNSKTDQEILSALELGVVINVDSQDELERVSYLARERTARVCLRVIPNIKVDTIPEFVTGIAESKFGLDIHSGEASGAIELCKNLSGVKLIGFHCHIGSQIESVEPYEKAVDAVVSLASETASLGHDIEVINMGGGFGFNMCGDTHVPPINEFGRAIASRFALACRRHSLHDVQLVLEPGASLVADAGIALLSVNSVKKRPSGRVWVALDGGADVMLRATQNWYKYEFVNASKPCGEPISVNLAGPICYSGDVLSYDAKISTPQRGDIIMALRAGAYTVCLYNSYNARVAPAVVLLSGSDQILISRRGTFEDLVLREMSL